MGAKTLFRDARSAAEGLRSSLAGVKTAMEGIDRVAGAASFTFEGGGGGSGDGGASTVTRGTGGGGSGGGSAGVVTSSTGQAEDDRLLSPSYCIGVNGGITRSGPLMAASVVAAEGAEVKFNGRVIGYRVGRCVYPSPDVHRSSATSSGGVYTSGSGPVRVPLIAGGPDGGAQYGSRTVRPGKATGSASVSQSFDFGGGDGGGSGVARAVDRMRSDLGSKLDQVNSALQGGGMAEAIRRAR